MIILIGCRDSPSSLVVEEGMLNINGSEIYHRKIGNGDPIIVIHGGPVMDHTYLLPQMDQLADEYQLIYYDQRACGKSSVDVDSTTMSIQGFAEDIRILIDSLNLEKPIIFGHSWGGLIAMKFVISYPDLANKLILCNSIPPDSEEWADEQKVMAEKFTEDQGKRRQEILSSGELQSNPSSAIKKLLKLSFENQFFDIKNLDSLNLEVPEDYMARSAKFGYLAPDLSQFNYYPALSELNLPTLIIYGDQEPAATTSGLHMAETLKRSSLEILKDCGHFPFIEQPNHFFPLLREFMND